jgi:uncharacterized membrane protein
MMLMRNMTSFSNILNYLVLKFTKNPTLFFVFSSFIFGSIFIFLIPPFQNPDEFTHFTRTYEVSELKTGSIHHRNGVDIKGSELPKSIQLTYNITKLHANPRSIDVPMAKKYAWDQTIQSINIPLNKSDKYLYDTGSSPAYVPLVYAPQALIVKVLSIINLPVIVLLYATRLVGLLIWIILAGLAIKILSFSFLRIPLAGVLLLPMFVAQAASPGNDGFLTGLTVLFFVIIINLILLKKELSNSKLMYLTLLLLLMVLAKPVYIVLGLLIFTLRSRYKKFTDFMYKCTAIALPLFAYILWAVLTKDHEPIYVGTIAISHADPSMQVGYLFPNVFNFVEPFINTLVLGWGDSVFMSFIGVFGKLDTPLPLVFITIGYLVLLVATFSTSENNQTFKNLKQFNISKATLGVTIIFIIGVYLGMYVYSTPPHTKAIIGIQGRYLLPLVPLLMLFMPKNLAIIRKGIYNSILTILPISLLIVSALIVFLRYYTTYP